MRRREFMILLGAAIVAWPLAGGAQQPAGVARIGILSDTASPPTPFEAPFAQGLRDLGRIRRVKKTPPNRFADGPCDGSAADDEI